MKSLKFILLATVFCSTLLACEKEALNEDELMLNTSDIMYATGGEVDSGGGID